jgi:hypothetical protein
MQPRLGSLVREEIGLRITELHVTREGTLLLDIEPSTLKHGRLAINDYDIICWMF